MKTSISGRKKLFLPQWQFMAISCMKQRLEVFLNPCGSQMLQPLTVAPQYATALKSLLLHIWLTALAWMTQVALTIQSSNSVKSEQLSETPTFDCVQYRRHYIFPLGAKIFRVLFIRETITSRLQPHCLQAEIVCQLQCHIRVAIL